MLSLFTSCLDSEGLPTNSLWQMACIILGTFYRSQPISMATLTILTCGSKPPEWCVIIRLLNGTNLTCAQPNCYAVCVSDESLQRYLARFTYLRQVGGRFLVTFSSSTGAPLPDPQLLALHAVGARVVHVSGYSTR